MTSTETLLSTKDFSERSGIPTSTLQKWLRNGKLTGTKKNRRWYIPDTELPRVSASEKTPQSEASGPVKKAVSSTRTYSVADFSALTYLTDIGVQRWLKSGRLLGEQTENGLWMVKAESLALPHLSHLIRQ